MIDPLHSLAFSMQSNRGVYAVLIGSGISKAAGIPTGWDVTLNLVRKLAAVRNETPEPDPESWFRDTFGTAPDYSELLDQLAKTQSERQQLLRGYWEPTEEEREEGEKEPTAAHHAIAALAARDFIKVIITTNFDKLMERALSAAGVEPTVLSTADQIQGAPALVHTQHLVFKVHGDYLDTRILNTEKELAAYPPEVDALLDRIFDEYGLIVCGWSGDWDPALRAALERAASRRYTTYWTTRRDPRADAQRLIAHRAGEVIRIEDADTFFEKLKEEVTAIEETAKPHPLSVDVAVTKLKRYMSEPRHRIELSDLIEETVQEVVETLSDETFTPTGPNPPTSKSITHRVRAYDAACSKLTSMAVVAGRWADAEQWPLWHRALERLSGTRKITATAQLNLWRDLQRYPATLLLYSLGLGAVDGNQLEFLNSLLTTKVRVNNEEEMTAAEALPPSLMCDNSEYVMQKLEGMSGYYAPLNDWIREVLRVSAQRAIRDDTRFTRAFDELEILIAVAVGGIQEGSEHYTAPACSCYRRRGRSYSRIMEVIRNSVEEEKAESGYVRSGIFGTDREECHNRLRDLDDFVGGVVGGLSLQAAQQLQWDRSQR